MPVYEYECTKCGAQLEVFQKISDPPITKCEACNGRLKKLISQSTFHLKGTGWYVTDYASKNKGGETRKKSSSGDHSSSTAKTKEGSGNSPSKNPSSSTGAGE
ncbi:MAG: zinc ribbon domain-containing protein [Deltaproteobacteria bacterium]|nr:zinc ribbon domain-containing protein [Deltaproteobacteria bacterium]MBW2015626.1 zinc ribbon domain-containing protein [Deltaproteobacteria bacterium]MBW2129771.1 zinc ribbon domain-containing protein [Deltaproteobacteria bacterium]MBW2302487.1 zinc ribbon domain-containing protein [Deltaproteobacteria bacterium]